MAPSGKMLPILILLSVYIVYAQTNNLPELPTRFTAIVEANIIQKNQTWIMEEWYDGLANKAKRTFYWQNLISTTYEDFNHNKDQMWSYVTTHEATDNAISCTLEPYSQNRSPFNRDETQSGHLISSAEWFLFGANYTEKYLGKNFVIRGISAEAWTRNVTFSFPLGTKTMNQSFALTYYFSVESWNWFKSSKHRIPLRVEVKGQRTTYNDTFLSVYDYDHYYDYVQFLADDLTLDEELKLDITNFYEQCNVTSYCDTYPTNQICSLTKGPKMPTLPDQWYAVMEGTSKIQNSSDDYSSWVYTGTWVLEEWFDYAANEAHSVWHSGPDWRGDALHQLDRLDVDQKWVWFGDGDDEDSDGDEIQNCQLTPGISGFSGYDLFVAETNGHVSKSSTWFGWNDTGHTTAPIWLGYTTFRGIPAEKWRAVWSEFDEYPESPLQETYAMQFDADTTYYWSNETWNMACSGWDGAVPLGITMEGTYKLYNYSESSGKYDILWTANSFSAEYHYVVFNAGEQDEDFFAIPKQWKECDITLYCDEYPNNEPCGGKISGDSSSMKDKGGLNPGYIVLMVVLFVIGLLIGALIDRYYVRKQGKASFVFNDNTRNPGKQTETTAVKKVKAATNF